MFRKLTRPGATRPLRTALIVAVLAALSWACLPASGLGAAVRSFSSAGSPVRFAATQLGTLSALTKQAGRYQVVVIQASEAHEIPLLKARNPNVKVLLYQDPFLARYSDIHGLTVCSKLARVQASDPSWLLRNNQGQTLQDTQQPGNFIMNLGNAAYQRSCVRHAIALAKSVGADGVLWDDINASLRWYLTSSTVVPSYPTESSWDNAQTRFLSYATGQLHAHGLLNFANLGGSFTVRGLWEKWSAVLDGSEEQSWNNWQFTGAYGVAYEWKSLLTEPTWSAARGKYTILESIDHGEAENTFGLASMLLVANGQTSYSTANLDALANEQWYPTYAAARTLGAPLGTYQKLTGGLYERRFAHGFVVVNPTRHGRGVALPGVMRNSATGHRVSRIYASALSGYIFTSG